MEGKTGWLVMPHGMNGDFAAFEPQAVAAKLREALLNPQQLASMGHAARAHVLATYTVDRCCNAELQAYKRVLAQHQTGQR